MIPNDPVMLLSYANTWMRDHGGGFAEFLKSHALSEEQGAALCEKLAALDYHLDAERKKFV